MIKIIVILCLAVCSFCLGYIRGKKKAEFDEKDKL